VFLQKLNLSKNQPETIAPEAIKSASITSVARRGCQIVGKGGTSGADFDFDIIVRSLPSLTTVKFDRLYLFSLS
jgi:hypothetical protein